MAHLPEAEVFHIQLVCNSRLVLHLRSCSPVRMQVTAQETSHLTM